MKLAHPSMISKIDKYAEQTLLIPTRILMERAGRAIADAVREYVKPGTHVSIFAGKGNNGADGYAAALELLSDYDVTVYDVFSCGQRTDDGKHFLHEFQASGGRVENLTLDGMQVSEIRHSSCVVDAVFGTGFSGEYPELAVQLSALISSLSHVKKIAADVPLGVDAASGRIDTRAIYRADATVTLGFVKPGLVSYPAREYVGKLIYDNLGLHYTDFSSCFDFDNYYIDYELATELIPERPKNSNKGSFGKLLMITGSSDFVGAAHLTLEAALRSGVGLTSFLGESALCESLAEKFPEAIYKPVSISVPDAIDTVKELSRLYSAVLIGSGSSRSDSLRRLVTELLRDTGAPLILDADAINVLAEIPEVGRELIRASERTVVLTPHPLELARISGVGVDTIQSDRLGFAKAFAKDCRCILVLKGAGTVVTDGMEVYVNSTGSSALAKAGSGDVLAGHLAALIASGMDALRASALAVYLHGAAADSLAEELSEFGVTPSDLPREIARTIRALTNGKDQ